MEACTKLPQSSKHNIFIFFLLQNIDVLFVGFKLAFIMELLNLVDAQHLVVSVCGLSFLDVYDSLKYVLQVLTKCAVK